MKNTQSLSQMPNIGSSLVTLLNEADIHTSTELINMGAFQTFIRIRAIDPDACFSKLCALEGATQGIRWHKLTPDKRMELHQWFKQLPK